MRCIFCKKDSKSSKSREHIVPESMGNEVHILVPGIVCDKCNNYFARKIEKPFLEHTTIKLLRFEEDVYSKKGKIPPAQAILNHRYPVNLHKEPSKDFVGFIDVPTEEIVRNLQSSKRGELIVMAYNDNLPFPTENIISRFIAKIAFEALALRLHKTVDGLDFLINESQFDEIRNHVRIGVPKDWDCNIRRIYNMNKLWKDTISPEMFQNIYEYDFLYTEDKELYFVFAYFGLEFVINIGCTSIDGYLEWLKANDDESPLSIKSSS